MTTLSDFIVIYLGRSQPHIDELHRAETVLTSRSGKRGKGMAGDGSLQIHQVTSQKATIDLVRQVVPDLIFIETDVYQERRLRLARRIRIMAPDAKIVATGLQRPWKRSTFDHYLPMPFTAKQIVDFLTELARARTPNLLQAGNLTLHPVRRIVSGPAGQHQLTPKLAELLALLMRRADRVIPRHAIMSEVWNEPERKDTRTLDVHIHWLREAIEPDPSDPALLVTVRGEGYRLVKEV